MSDLASQIQDLADDHLEDTEGDPQELLRRIGKKLERHQRESHAARAMMANLGEQALEAADARGPRDLESLAAQAGDL